jgi:hypothetical protein
MKHFSPATLRMTMVTLLLITSSLAAEPGYHLAKTYTLGGEGSWDYLTFDTASRHLFISRATHVIVIDADSGKPVGDIPDTPGVHGIALALELGRGFISNGREGTVSIVDLNTLKTLSKVKAGDKPDAILYDSATKRVFAFNGRSHDATAIDAEKGTVVGTIKLDGKPEFAVSDEKGRVFVIIEDKSELAALDPNMEEVKALWPLAPGPEPSGVAGPDGDPGGPGGFPHRRARRRRSVGTDIGVFSVWNRAWRDVESRVGRARGESVGGRHQSQRRARFARANSEHSSLADRG